MTTLEAKTEMFKDKSIFEAIRDFETPYGLFRFVRDFGNNWSVYTDSGRAWVFVGRVKTKSEKPTNETLFELYCNLPESE